MTEPIRTLFTGHVPTDPQRTWDAFADSERFGRLAGMDLHFAYVPAPDGGIRREGRQRHLGLELTWDEAPVHFDAPRHYLIVRHYHGGPALRYESELHVTPDATGSTVTLAFRYVPRSALLRPAVALDAALVVRPQLARAFAAILTALQEDRPVPDAPPPPLNPTAQHKLDTALGELAPDVAGHLRTHLLTAPLAERIRLSAKGATVSAEFRSGMWTKDTIRTDGAKGAVTGSRFFNARQIRPDGQLIGFLPQEYPKFNVVDFSTKGMSFYHLDTGKIEPHPNTEKLFHLYNPSFPFCLQ